MSSQGSVVSSLCTVPLTHFTPDSLIYSVSLFLKRQCDQTPGPAPARAAGGARGRIRRAEGGAGRGKRRGPPDGDFHIRAATAFSRRPAGLVWRIADERHRGAWE
jgi:hypothetical protein